VNISLPKLKNEKFDDDHDDDNDDDDDNKIERTWNVKRKVIPVIIGATRNISKSFRKYMSNIPGKHEVKKLQKTAILDTANKLRKVLM